MSPPKDTSSAVKAGNSIVDLIGNTPLVLLSRLSPNSQVRIWGKLEGQNPTGSVKDRVALALLEQARESGALSDDKILLEPTSGNTGVSLAFLAGRDRLRVACVMPETASIERAQMIEVFGGEVIYSPGDKGSNGAIEMAVELASDPKYFMPNQYANEANPQAHYRTTGPEVLRDLPTVTHFVAGLGTGGTLTGVGRYFRERKPDVQIIAAEPELGDLVYGLRSLEEGFVPPVLDPSVIDRKFKVNAGDSVKRTQELAADEGIFAGVSSGAVLHAALRLAAEVDRADVVCLFADAGWKYLSTGLWTVDAAQAAETVEKMPW